MAYVQLIIVVCVTFLSFNLAFASIECQKCTNLEASSSGGIFDKIIHSHSNPECKSGTYSQSTECDNTDTCYYTDFSVTFDVVLFGKITISGQERGCGRSGSYGGVGCKKVDPDAVSIIKQLSALGGTPVDIDGQYCQCNTPLCDASCKGPFSVGNFCVKWWLAATIGGVTVLLFVGLCVCCCCCCGCCCSSRSHGRHVPVQQYGIVTTTVPVQGTVPTAVAYPSVITQSTVPMQGTVPMQSAAGHNEFTNPGYMVEPNTEEQQNKVYWDCSYEGYFLINTFKSYRMERIWTRTHGLTTCYAPRCETFQWLINMIGALIRHF